MECDKVTGRCFDGCQPGWGDPMCSKSTPFTILLLLFYLDIDQNNYLDMSFKLSVIHTVNLMMNEKLCT